MFSFIMLVCSFVSFISNSTTDVSCCVLSSCLCPVPTYPWKKCYHRTYLKYFILIVNEKVLCHYLVWMWDFWRVLWSLIICSLCRISRNLLVLMNFFFERYFIVFVCGLFVVYSLKSLTLHLVCQTDSLFPMWISFNFWMMSPYFK